MSMKITDLYKSKMLKAASQMKHGARYDPLGKGSAIPNRKDKRKLDQAAGLVPFACKLPNELVVALTEAAAAKQLSMNALVAALLKNGLAGSVEAAD